MWTLTHIYINGDMRSDMSSSSSSDSSSDSSSKAKAAAGVEVDSLDALWGFMEFDDGSGDR